ncbi:MAG: two-component regulator propeller domain-containing protein [Bacteroidota bacterium]
MFLIRFHIWLVCLTIFILAGELLFAQERLSIRFDQLHVEQGLSQGSISAMMQDRRGFLWISTDDGFNRFDGYQFLVFRPKRGDAQSLSSNIITAVAEDANGRIWIGTFGSGFQSYDPSTNLFTSYKQQLSKGATLSTSVITALAVDAGNRIWIGSDSYGLLVFNPAAGTLKRFSLPGAGTVYSVTDITTTSSGKLVIACGTAGLYILDPGSGNAQRINMPAHPLSAFSVKVARVAMQGARYLWAGTDDNRLHRYDVRTATWKTYFLRSSAIDDFAVEIRDMTMDMQGNMWVATSADGLFILRTADGNVTHIAEDRLRPWSLPSSSIRSLFADRFGNVWVGTNGSGLALYSPSAKNFNLIMPGLPSDEKLTINSYRAIWQDSDSTLWLGGYRGFNSLNRKTGKVSVYDRDPAAVAGYGPQRGINSGNVFVIHPDARDPERFLILGTEGNGLYRFDKKSGLFWRIPVGDERGIVDKLQLSVIYEIFQTRDGELWIGGSTGLYRWKQGSQHDYPTLVAPGSFGTRQGGVWAIHEDETGLLWIGTGRNGLTLFDRLDNDVTNFHHNPADSSSLSSNTIKCIFQDSRGILWVGTTLGLNKMNRRDGTFVSYTTQDGLPNDVIYGILEDEAGYLWLSTNRGLARFHPKYGVVSTFDVHDGLQGNEFNTAAYFKARDGELFFGGVQGLTHFYPAQITRNQFVPPLVVSSIKVGNTAVLLDNTGNGSDTVRLGYDDESITFTFSALSFYRPEKNRYRYRIEGRNEEWIDLGNDRFLSFAGLNPGEYILNVCGSNNDGVWNEEGLVIVLIIEPPFWATWWFRILAVVLVVGFVIIGFRWRIARIRSDEKRLTAEVELRTNELQYANSKLLLEIEERKHAEAEAYRANATKSEFLAHISHEIRTPMNAILGFTELLYDRIQDEELRSHLSSISLSGKTLITLINDLLDLSKIEAGKLELIYQPTSIRAVIDEIRQLFVYQVSRKNLTLEVLIHDQVPQILYLDETRMRQILLNLVGNAVKFTDKGTITVELKSVPKEKANFELTLLVKDTGIGIAPSQQQRVFEPFRQGGRGRNTEYGGTGLGLAITQRLVQMMGGEISLTSRLGAGSVFRVTLPDVAIAADLSTSEFMEESLSHAPFAEPVQERDAYNSELQSISGMNASQEDMRKLYEYLSRVELLRWERLKRTYIMHELESFANDLRLRAEQAHYLPLVEWSARLVREVRSFDMASLPLTLNEFPRILAVLNEQGSESASPSVAPNHHEEESPDPDR